ncbi:MAG: VacJ family lipoprotein [Chthoniobacterales bacterium]|nr:VacJ family lipoprotein [Chthoniobacterales bacterium]
MIRTALTCAGRTPLFALLSLAVIAPLLTSCSTPPRKPAHAASAVGTTKSDGKSVRQPESEWDEYSGLAIADPLEPLNRVTFTVNHGLYTFLLRPISSAYRTVFPKVVRTGISNAFENVKFPIRLVNDTLQGNFKRAGQETGRFLVNSTLGIGGLGRPADHMPALADVPPADTGQTFAKWGIGHGPYLVLPLLGPSSLRDTVGLAGDYALNPVSWVTIVYGGYAWTLAIPCSNTVRAMPDQFDIYDAATKNSLDRYVAARSSYIQFRDEVAKK